MLAMTMAMLLTGAGGVQRTPSPVPAAPTTQSPPVSPPVPMVIMPPAPPLRVMPMAPPPPPPPPSPSRIVTPPRLIRAPQTCAPFEEEEGVYDFSECFNGGDYPLAAYEARAQGVATVRVTLGADGRPTACEVAVSSGSVALNRASCDLLRQRILRAYDGEARRVTAAVIGGEVRWSLPAGPPRDTRPDLLTYFSMNDYPASALRNEEQGTVGARVEVDPSGRVAGCTVTSSSGSSALDAATCRIMRVRVRYRPALDGRMRPVPGATLVRVTWQLPAE